jgi:hypothetical protein
MSDAPDLLDSAYEYAGFQASGSFQDALSGLAVPLLFALAGVAWRVFRVAEDGVVRPLGFHVLTLFLVAWLASPRSSDPAALPHLRAPRAIAMLDSAADLLVRRAVRGVDRDFLARPFEWERLALLAHVSRVQDSELTAEVRSFLDDCVPAAMVRAGTPPPDAARRNPVADDSGLAYSAVVDASGRSCETVRRSLVDAIGREVDWHPLHQETLKALAAYSGEGESDLRTPYIDKLIRNAWLGPDPVEGEAALARRSLGTYRWFDADRRTMRYPFDAGRDVNTLYDLIMFPSAAVGEVANGIYAEASQWLSESTESKQRYYLVTTHAPHLYGLTLMLLMALFPIAALCALLPGKWTALLHFTKVFFSVKLWPFGWSLLTAFTERRPSALALADAASDLRAPIEHALRIGETPNLFITISLMYIVVPGVTFLCVQMVSQAAALPFQAMLPKPTGGSTGGAAGQAAAALAG